MIQPITIVCVLLSVTATVFVFKFYNVIAPDDMRCDMAAACVYKERVNSTIKGCQGDMERCCKYLRDQKDVDATYNLIIYDPVLLMTTQLGACFGVFVLVFIGNLSYMVETYENSTFWCFIGFSSTAMILITLDILAVILIGVISLTADAQYYWTSCQGYGLVITSWIIVSCFLLIDFVFRVWWKVRDKVKTHKFKRSVYMNEEDEDNDKIALLMSEIKSIKNNTSHTLTGRVIRILGGLYITSWLIGAVYLIGVAYGRWNIIV